MTECMVRPCVARGFRRSEGFGSLINVSGLRLERVLRATMDISAHSLRLLGRRPCMVDLMSLDPNLIAVLHRQGAARRPGLALV